MKEKEFIKEVNEMNLVEGFIVKLCYSLDNEGNVLLDEEGMTEEFEMKLRELKEILD